ncbi:MAG TPA: hypothetical protein VGG01_06405, partial [Xanthobacteraceae bacterium]
ALRLDAGRRNSTICTPPGRSCERTSVHRQTPVGASLFLTPEAGRYHRGESAVAPRPRDRD